MESSEMGRSDLHQDSVQNISQIEEENRFLCLYQQNFVRLAAAHIPLRLASPHHNADAILKDWKRAQKEGGALILFPELSLTGYSLDELYFQELVLEESEKALAYLVKESASLETIAVIGMAVRHKGQLYNCAIIMHQGRILGCVPKTYLPRYREFYETRYFKSGEGISSVISLLGQDVPFGTDLIFSDENLKYFSFAVEICEDLWSPNPPSVRLAAEGALILLNLSASPAMVGKRENRHLLCAAHSLKTMSAYIYAATGCGESTAELTWDGHLLFYEAGSLLAENKAFSQEESFLMADIDLLLLAQERLRTGYCYAEEGQSRCQKFTFSPHPHDRGLLRTLSRFPFVRKNGQEEADFEEIMMIQSHALAHRMREANAQKFVIGVSGGLDSALALLVCVHAAKILGWSPSSILAYTMPGFATGTESLGYAQKLMESLGVTAKLLDIRSTALAMLQEIDHPFARGEEVYDVTFENIQAGLRTDFLFRLANHHHGLVIGTGDLSELALGWCTYGVGDQMSHYNVNAGLPKTVIQTLMRVIAYQEKSVWERCFSQETRFVVRDIVEAEISPELVPAGKEGKIQSTEEKIGPYLLQDFTLFYVLRYGFSPRRIAFLAEKIWTDPEKGSWSCYYPESQKKSYRREEIVSWLRVFMWRFFQISQFKRSAMPNGPKIIPAISLSPRGDWRAPSDGNADLWMCDIEGIPLS